MKYICLGYIQETNLDALTPNTRDAMKLECTAYTDTLRRNGHVLGGERSKPPATPLPSAGRGDAPPSPTAPSLRRRNNWAASSFSTPPTSITPSNSCPTTLPSAAASPWRFAPWTRLTTSKVRATPTPN